MTFIELIVVLSIFGMVSAVVMFRGGDFTRKINIQNLAQDFALAIRKAQSEALSGRLVSPTGTTFSEDSKVSYGIYINSANSFYYYSDINNDNNLSSTSACGTAGGECISNINLNGGVITNICFDKKAGANNCYQPNAIATNVLFVRPFPNAVIKNSAGPTSFSDVGITITTLDSKFSRTIFISSTGQISVE